jgi:hypothetical protein
MADERAVDYVIHRRMQVKPDDVWRVETRRAAEEQGPDWDAGCPELAHGVDSPAGQKIRRYSRQAGR